MPTGYHSDLTLGWAFDWRWQDTLPSCVGSTQQPTLWYFASPMAVEWQPLEAGIRGKQRRDKTAWKTRPRPRQHRYVRKTRQEGTENKTRRKQDKTTREDEGGLTRKRDNLVAAMNLPDSDNEGSFCTHTQWNRTQVKLIVVNDFGCLLSQSYVDVAILRACLIRQAPSTSAIVCDSRCHSLCSRCGHSAMRDAAKVLRFMDGTPD